MAEDTAELLRQFGIEKSDILGSSLVGGTAIELAIRHPDRVCKLVVISAFNQMVTYLIVFISPIIEIIKKSKNPLRNI